MPGTTGEMVEMPFSNGTEELCQGLRLKVGKPFLCLRHQIEQNEN